MLFLLGYLALHWLLAVPVWDRYLLPLVPLAALLLGRVAVLAAARLQALSFSRAPKALLPAFLILLALFLLLTPSALAARAGRFPLGGQENADHGAWQVAAYLAHAPYGTVLYDHWFSWHWRYAFIDKGVYTNWFDHPAGLVDDLEVFGQAPGERYLVLPDDERALPVLRSLEASNFAALPLLHTSARPGMILYRLEPS